MHDKDLPSNFSYNRSQPSHTKHVKRKCLSQWSEPIEIYDITQPLSTRPMKVKCLSTYLECMSHNFFCIKLCFALFKLYKLDGFHSFLFGRSIGEMLCLEFLLLTWLRLNPSTDQVTSIALKKTILWTYLICTLK